jgi:hypothetical protein
MSNKPSNLVRHMTTTDIDVLKAIARGHPDRRVTVLTGGDWKKVSGLTWEEVQLATQATAQEIGDPIAVLIQKGLIASGREHPSFFGSLAGQKVKMYVWITSEGENTLASLTQPKSTPHWLATDDISTVEHMLYELGFHLTQYGVGVATLNLQSGYSDAETASHIALVTIAWDVRELGPDVRALVAIAGHVSGMLHVLKGYKDKGLIQEKLLQNDVLALIKITNPSPESEEWINRVLSDEIAAKERCANSIQNYDLPSP